MDYHQKLEENILAVIKVEEDGKAKEIENNPGKLVLATKQKLQAHFESVNCVLNM